MTRQFRFAAVLLSFFICSAIVLAQNTPDTTALLTDRSTITTQTIPAPQPVTNVTASDSPDDHGHSITITWTKSADDGVGSSSVAMYSIFRSASPDGPFVKVGAVPFGEERFTNSSSRDAADSVLLANNRDYYYRVDAITVDTTVRSSSQVAGPAQATGQWYNVGRTVVLLSVIIFTLLTLIFISKAKRGDNLYVRPLAGIEAVDEAIGRATEMGKPILYVMGLGTAQDIATIASFTILSRVSKKVAEYQTDLLVPCYDPIVFTIAQEIVQSSFLDAGRPEAYKDDMVYFVTQAQFAYVAAVNGTMVRVKPATNLYLGKFYAESLMLAETGSVTGSIQISGTDEVAQIPFFVVACDYTLIGEELYAASAYLGREPVLLGSLKGQDWAKGLLIICALAGIVAAGVGAAWFVNLFKVVN